MPGAKSEGTVYWKVLGSTMSAFVSDKLPSVVLVGQPPMMEWMTCHLVDADGCGSDVSAIWHEPPPSITKS